MTKQHFSDYDSLFAAFPHCTIETATGVCIAEKIIKQSATHALWAKTFEYHVYVDDVRYKRVTADDFVLVDSFGNSGEFQNRSEAMKSL